MKVELQYAVELEVDPRIIRQWQLIEEVAGKMEVSWFHFVEKTTENGNIRYKILGNPLIPKQVCTSVTVDITDKQMMSLIETAQVTEEEAEYVRCWCHTHPGMTAIPSGVDDRTFGEIMDRMGFVIGIIVSGQNIHTRVFDSQFDWVVTDVPIVFPEVQGQKELIAKLVKENVQKPVVQKKEKKEEVDLLTEKEIRNWYETTYKRQRKFSFIEGSDFIDPEGRYK